MAISHAAPGQVITLRPGPGVVAPADSETLIRADHLEVFRYALPAGKAVQQHTAAGLMVVQCLAGTVEFKAMGRSQRLASGTMMYLPDGEPHELTAITDTVLLITLLLHRA